MQNSGLAGFEEFGIDMLFRCCVKVWLMHALVLSVLDQCSYL